MAALDDEPAVKRIRREEDADADKDADGDQQTSSRGGGGGGGVTGGLLQKYRQSNEQTATKTSTGLSAATPVRSFPWVTFV